MGMRVLKLQGESIYASFKSSVIQQARGYAKSYMYLHKQLWLKDKLKESGTGFTIKTHDGVDHPELANTIPKRIISEVIPGFTRFKDRPVEYIKMWNIKSWSYSEYMPNDLAALGLNQIFDGQSPTDRYEGDIKDGIYHDDCYITPRCRYLDSGSVDCWAYATTTEDPENPFYLALKVYFYKFPKYSGAGIQLLENVEIEQYTKQETKSINGVATLVDYPARRLKFTPKVGDVYYYDLGKYGEYKNVIGSTQLMYAENPEAEWLDFGLSQKFVVGSKDALVPWVREPTEEEYEAEFGKLLYKKKVEYPKALWHITGSQDDATSMLQVTDADGNEVPGVTIHHARSYATGDGWIKVFISGVVLEYVPYTVEGYTDESKATNAHYKILPMMYTDTGDLTMPHRQFIDKWDQNCELHVYEKSDIGFFKIIAVIIIIIVTYFTAGTATPLLTGAAAAMSVVGAIFSIIGILGGDKTMMLLGSVFGGLAAIYNSITTTVTEGMASSIIATSAPTMTAGRAADLATSAVAKMTFSELLTSFSSIAGMTNIFSIGVKIIPTVMQIKELFSPDSMTAPQDVPLDDEVGLTLEFGFDKEAEAMDPVMQLQKEIDLVIRPEL